MGFGTVGSAPDQVRVDGYDAFFARARVKSGYSGTATYVRSATARPDAARAQAFVDLPPGTAGLSSSRLHELDDEGRAVVTHHAGCVVVFNVYCPNSGATEDRAQFKAEFNDTLRAAMTLEMARGHAVVLVGDLNAVHDMRDMAYADELPSDWEPSSTWRWLDGLLALPQDGGLGMVDAFRALHPDATRAFTCWNTQTEARLANHGSRIDYVLVDAVLAPAVAACWIDADRMGSDHAPVVADLQLAALAPLPRAPPPLASIYLPELAGSQATIDAFVAAARSCEPAPSSLPRPAPKSKPKSAPASKPVTLRQFFTPHAAKPRRPATLPPPVAASPATRAVHNSTSTMQAWTQLLKPQTQDAVPLCRGHREPTKRLVVNKPGLNQGREFFICARPRGPRGDLRWRCSFFLWASEFKAAVRKRHRPSPATIDLTSSPPPKRARPLGRESPN
ncbi:DNA-(apurinic or apyrimidinic site) lyase 2 [Thecamonas trahens ATCC 50062]|uniref:DNA-(apurinic or apyrimidinic site) endonuclease n=1 Tax=Thecamonas trahens ATCC 50062 TaxID=461836 RepID=A0A0L0DJK8_THETB|nr:DNA-(apurinic or apyrimidinic site) lyase 2 [Thecamonas trahens ATCC 50062]KNC52291.1 DNA-(apurinic or apyrimidinic site) lyase 2 [Thecamonas trahens ATCC 50062]|eukprot:XP_013762290.1 DNA-(apurinic or apyrimidinic site) lyase 2 [Thecamonas trahens ATCC 50062]